MGTILGVPMIRTIVYWSLYWGTLILGNYHLILQKRESTPPWYWHGEGDLVSSVC